MATPDLTEFHKLSKPKKKPCPIAAAVDQLDTKGEDGEKLSAALKSDPGNISHPAIQKWLEARGIETRWQTVASHRRGTCGCDSDG